MIGRNDIDAYFERMVALGYLSAETKRDKDLFWMRFIEYETEEPEFVYTRDFGTFKPMTIDLNPMVENNFDEDRDDD